MLSPKISKNASSSVSLQIHPRQKRGGATIPRLAVVAELQAVFGASFAIDLRPEPGRIDAVLSPLDGRFDDDTRRIVDHIAERANRLGYVRAIVRQTSIDVPFAEIHTVRRRGFAEGTAFSHGRTIALDALFVAPNSVAASRAPETDDDDDGSPTKRRPGVKNARRRLSIFDARFAANICEIDDGGRVLDPFAGAGTLVYALANRGLTVTGADLDHACVDRVRSFNDDATRASALFAVRHDAAALPFADESFDGVVTEPPFRRFEREAVVRSVPEMCRVVRKGGTITLIMARSVTDAVVAALPVGVVVDASFPTVRHGLLGDIVRLRRVDSPPS